MLELPFFICFDFTVTHCLDIFNMKSKQRMKIS